MRFNINAPFWRFMDTLLRFVGLNLVYPHHADPKRHHRPGTRGIVFHNVRL